MNARVRLDLTIAEARALQAMVDFTKGACEGEPDMTRIYRKLAAERASDKLDAAIGRAVAK